MSSAHRPAWKARSVSHTAVRRDDPGRPLRVAMVVPPYFDVPPKAYGGVEAVVADLADALVDRGHSVTLIGAGRPGTKARFVPVWDRTVPELLGEPYPEVMHAVAARRAVQRLAATGGVDVVHDHTLAGPLNAPAYGVPTVVTVHGPVGEDMARYYSELGDDVHLVAISDRQRELAPGLNWIGTVHNALRLADWPYESEKDDYALFLGRFHPDKAPHLALEAAHRAGLRLILAGKCAEPVEKEYFEREVRPRLTEHDHVFGVADATAKRELLAKARCLLFPIQWEEPFGMVMIEAMACGTPVVALRSGAVPEVVVDGVTGLVRDDPADLVRALHDVRHLDPAKCRAHVAEHFDIGGLGAGYEAAYRRAVEVSSLRRDYAALDSALDRAYDQMDNDGPALQPSGGRP
ncbi:glycosyltransferase involved in cell wall biosynthesis [Amycolatopsis thermophila]|uniref:Glycosyltransferase involved in cell wall biosynthesis n=1 Tax=Amycolatopsis thermophila TaxID=206084 RepID=A0ABU0ER87_9PSEU|nr:glycosyltransferase family 4 protein [Amycolatopsis thermophila]MDQ0377603.1 glycosyltransferase involved in cell wall biosynthesis [Amycolatopsis thermophila]